MLFIHVPVITVNIFSKRSCDIFYILSNSCIIVMLVFQFRPYLFKLAFPLPAISVPSIV